MKRILCIVIVLLSGCAQKVVQQPSSKPQSAAVKASGKTIAPKVISNEAPRTPASVPPKLSLNVKNAPLDKVLRNLASEANRSLVLGNAVNGNVTASFKNIDYEKAIDTLLRPTAYRAEHSGDVTIIRSAKDDKTYKSFKLKYIDVNTVLKTVTDIASKDAQVSVDANTNSLFVVDRFEIIRYLETMLDTLDKEPRQVEVEAAMIEMDFNDNLNYGVDYSGIIHHGANGTIQTPINTARMNPLDPTSPNTKGSFVGLSWNSVRAIVGLLAQQGTLNVLARPRVLALTDQEATIVMGSRLGYKTVTVTTTGSVEDVKFLTVGTQLRIKPHITMNNDILMYIKPEISDGQIDPRTNLPNENTTATETKVLSKNGQTIVIGGLVRDRIEKKVDKFPILGDIPLLSLIFANTTDTMVKTEIVILISPKLVRPENFEAAPIENSREVNRFRKVVGKVP